MMLRWSVPCVMVVAAAACRSSDVINPDRCLIFVAQIDPAAPVLQLGDTVTMRATFSHSVSPECLPTDTTAAGLRWISSEPAAITVDPTAGRLTARRPGWAQIMVVPVGGGRVLGTTFAKVLEPPSADSLISVDPQSSSLPTLDLAGVTPDHGC